MTDHIIKSNEEICAMHAAICPVGEWVRFEVGGEVSTSRVLDAAHIEDGEPVLSVSHWRYNLPIDSVWKAIPPLEARQHRLSTDCPHCNEDCCEVELLRRENIGKGDYEVPNSAGWTSVVMCPRCATIFEYSDGNH